MSTATVRRQHEAHVGAALRDEGQSATIAADVSVTKGHGDDIRFALDVLMTFRPSPWTCDDVRKMAARRCQLNGRTFDPSPNLLPAIIGGYVGSGRIVRVSDATSSRRSRHAARVGTYLGAKYATPATH